MRVRLTSPAYGDLEDIASFFQENSPTAGAAIAAELEHLFSLLGSRPNLGRATDRPPVRRLTSSRYPYIIYYQVTADTVEILSVFHTARRRDEEKFGS